ncbi:MAG: hypothetical protein KZQ70_06090 [gamma proteobacterium symbiont of Lucinoma myriamae]|nr:hypothetical protein [gamma proteobacterium symbiont of Lucinoma myriamae]MCU7818223.1 hypothetical protein [gamma proteobacterium symbiont of Lucinoma myriamae]MCU7832102.1 hypothetical protein [gamma proteobacterium symbiont of Lucinoma myriamae]
MSIPIQQKNERLSAFIDAEQSDSETGQIVEALLNDPAYKEQYVRLKLANEHLHEQVQTSVLNSALRDNISLALDDLPAHFVDEAVSLQSAKTEDITQAGWFNRLFENRMLSGVSIAASVMFITLFTLQGFKTDTGFSNIVPEQSLADTKPIHFSMDKQTTGQSTPSLIQPVTLLPASYVSSTTAAITNNDPNQQYQWIEADPALSQQVRQYVREHEMHQASYNLQPQIRTATYQIND